MPASSARMPRPTGLSLTATRSWADNGDYIPQESELGPLSNANFGTLVTTTTYSPDLLTGNRPYSWQGSLQVQQELGRGLALNVGYFRTWYGNQARDQKPRGDRRRTSSLLRHGAGQCVAAWRRREPDLRLLRREAGARFGQSDTLIDLASKYGDPSQVFNGVDVNLTARLGGGRYVQAGLSTGSTTSDTCYANDRPDLLPEGRSTVGPEDVRILQQSAPRGRAGRSSKPWW